MIGLVERNYLEINSLNELIETIPPSKGIKLELLNPPDFNLSKFFYKQIGIKYHWFDRLDWSDNSWIQYTENENVKTYILKEAEEILKTFTQKSQGISESNKLKKNQKKSKIKKKK